MFGLSHTSRKSPLSALTDGWFNLPHPSVPAQVYGPIERSVLFGWHDHPWIDHGSVRFFRD